MTDTTNALPILLQRLEELQRLAPSLSRLKDEEYDTFVTAWHGLVDAVKLAAYDPRHQRSVLDFEFGWGAHSVQYVIDCLPEFHRVLRTYYRRKDVLRLLDVGAGSGAGSNLLASLHATHYVYSRIEVDAIDHTPVRRRWIKAMYPQVRYQVADLFELPDRQWDIVFCSAVVEHVENPRRFCEELVRVCKGFAFVYVPYKEVDRIPSHINTLDESLFEGMRVLSSQVIKSMAWHPAIPGDHMFLTTLDCRQP